MEAARRSGRSAAQWVAVSMLVVLSGAAAAHAEADEARLAGVRAVGNTAARLLSDGMARSATFRDIVAEITASNVLVYVEVRPLDLPGQLQFVAASPLYRVLRVSVRTPGLPTEQTAWLAHELWHAVEVARAPEVRDVRSLRKLYERIGDGGRHGDKVETVAAQQVWTRVLLELRAGRPSVAPR